MFMASCGCSLKYGLLVHILNPSETALLLFAFLQFNHSCIISNVFSAILEGLL
jgi:hypothetical protein